MASQRCGATCSRGPAGAPRAARASSRALQNHQASHRVTMSSSGTRLTDEFRYLLDMIILVVISAGGWFRHC